MPKLCWLLAEVSFYGSSSIWRACRLDQVIYQCGLTLPVEISLDTYRYLEVIFSSIMTNLHVCGT